MKDFKDSFLYWFPRIKEILGLNIPKTEIIELSEEDLISLEINDLYYFQENKVRFKIVFKKFNFPIFLRTDEFSKKHDWKDSCFVQNKDQFFANLRNLIISSNRINEACRALVIREFLHLQTTFKYFNEMPVAKERRYFISEGKVICHHPYWNEIAFETDDLCIKEKLKEINYESEMETLILKNMAKKVANVLEGNWSVDFACDISNKWWVIDMATAKHSWHPECDNLSKL